MHDRAWELLLRSLRRLVRFRGLQAPHEHVENEITIAKRFWATTGVTGWVDWPDDVRGVATELGFLNGATDAEYRAGIAAASQLQGAAAAIHERLAASADVEDLAVVIGGNVASVRGFMRSEDALARVRAAIDALASEWPRLRLRNEIVVRT